jgi:hypothetical protein
MAIEIVVGNKEIEATKMPPDSLGLNPIQPDAPVADGGKGIKLILNGYFFSIKLNARKTLDGNIMVYDHPNIDIVIIPTKNKIVSMPKKSYYHDTYPVQKRFFDFLESRGAIVLGSTRGGVVYNSLETYYPTNEELDVLQVILLLTKKFLEEETENSLTEKEYEEEVEQLYTNPDDDDSTELGEVPQAKKKGAIDPNYKPYNLLYRF